MAEAREVTAQWAQDARVSLASLPDTTAKAALESLCDFVVSRTS